MKAGAHGKALQKWLILVVLILTASWTGCGNKDPIRIGLVAGTVGRTADLGISGQDAAQLAVEECNRSGGIRGRKVRLLIKDDQQNPQKAQQAIRELIDEGAVAVIGPMTSDMAIAIVPMLNQAGLLAVSPTVATQDLSGLDDYFFRVTSTTADYASKSAAYQIKTGTMRRIAAIYDLGNRSFCENWLHNFEKSFVAMGGSIVRTIGFKSDAGYSFLKSAEEILTAAPDGVLIIANSMDAALICQQIRKMDAAIPLTLADWGATERLLEMGGAAVEGVTVVQTFDRESPAPAYQLFRKAFLQRYHREPGFPGVYAYDAAQVLLAALRASDSYADLKKTVLAIRHFQGLQSQYSFDDYGDVKRSHASISIVRNGKFVVVE